MSYQGTERRDTTAKGRAIREHVQQAYTEYGSPLSVDAPFREMTATELATMLGRLWTTAYAQGRADISREVRDELDAKLGTLLAEYGVR